MPFHQHQIVRLEQMDRGGFEVPCAFRRHTKKGLVGSVRDDRRARLEKPVAAVERAVKGLLFDCQMCGCCVLSSTGLSCPMNCPKNLRNGPEIELGSRPDIAT